MTLFLARTSDYLGIRKSSKSQKTKDHREDNLKLSFAYVTVTDAEKEIVTLDILKPAEKTIYN